MGQMHFINKIECGGTICIGNSVIIASPRAKNIEAMLDSQLDMSTHINYITRVIYHLLRNMGHIYTNINVEPASTLTHALTCLSSNLDTMKSLLVGFARLCTEKKMQLNQNNAARLVLSKKTHGHVTQLYMT